MKQEQKIKRIRARREKLKKKPSVLRKAEHPASLLPLESKYYSDIRRLTIPMLSAVKSILLPKIVEIKKRFNQDLRMDAPIYGKMISNTINSVKISFMQEFDHNRILKTVRRTSKKINEHNRVQVEKQFFTVLGVNPILQDKALEPRVASFVEENVSLIKTIPNRFFEELEGIVRRGIESGQSTRKMTAQIMDRYKVSKGVARRIARDQTNKFNGRLTEERQRQAGVGRYTWSSANDSRVRGRPGGKYPKARPSHWALNGKVFSWDKPPVSGVKGERQHPGEPIECRCVALPVLDDFK